VGWWPDFDFYKFPAELYFEERTDYAVGNFRVWTKVFAVFLHSDYAQNGGVKGAWMGVSRAGGCAKG